MATTSDFAEIKTMINRAAHPPTALLQTQHVPATFAAAAAPESADESEKSRPWAELIDDLLAVRNLHDDWDGQGAKAPPAALVDGAIRFAQAFEAQAIEPADRAIVSVNGTVYFEWHRPGGYVEVEVTAPDQAEARAAGGRSKSTEVVRFSWSR